METILNDLRYGWRALRSQPSFTLLAIVTLGLGIGAGTAMFSVVNGVLLQPLRFQESERLMSLFRYREGDPTLSQPFSLPDLRDVGEQVEGLRSVVGYNPSQLTLTGLGEPEVVPGARFTGPVLEIFLEAPALGRDIRLEEAQNGGDDVVMLGWSFFQDRFGGDEAILGTVLELSGAPHTVIGVAPPHFDFPQGAQLWVPRQMNLEDCGRDCHFLRALARIEPGATQEQVARNLTMAAQRLESEYPETNTGKRFAVEPLLSEMTDNVRPALLILLASVGALLLIATANVTNLVLVRGAGRQPELALRSAIGASRFRLFRQLLIENALIAVAASLFGVGLGAAMLKSLLRLAPPDLPRADEIGLDGSVLAFSLAASLLALLLFGLIPAWRGSQPELRSRLARRGFERSWHRSLLLASEIALSFVLLLGAGLLLRSFGNLVATDLGFERENVLIFGLDLPSTRYPEAANAVDFFAQVERRIAAVPGVVSVGASFASPLGVTQIGGGLRLLDRPEPEVGQRPSTTTNVVTPSYFTTMGVPLLKGRGFGPEDSWGNPPVVLINQAFADRYYPGRDPLGERLRSGVSFGYSLGEEEAFTVVGVVANTRAYGIELEPLPELFMAQAQAGSDFLNLTIRAQAGIEVLRPIEQAVHALDPNLPLRRVETLEQRIQQRLGPPRFYLILLTTFAALAVALAAIGLYGVISYMVTQRRREIAVRIALGAGRTRVQRMVLADGLLPLAAGLTIGTFAAWALGRYLESLLHEVSASDPATFVGTAMLLSAVTLLALSSPAVRASRVAPMSLLRET